MDEDEDEDGEGVVYIQKRGRRFLVRLPSHAGLSDAGFSLVVEEHPAGDVGGVVAEVPV